MWTRFARGLWIILAGGLRGADVSQKATKSRLDVARYVAEGSTRKTNAMQIEQPQVWAGVTINLGGILPKNVIPKDLWKSIQARSQKWADLQKQREACGDRAHHRAKKEFINTGEGSAPSLEEFQQRKRSVVVALTNLEADGVEDTRTALQLVRNATNEYLRDREDIERNEAELLRIKFTPGCVVNALRETVTRFENAIKKQRGCALRMLADHGIEPK